MKHTPPSEPTLDPMSAAFAEAESAGRRGEVPIGCVIVDQSGNVMASAGNRTLELKDPTAHAEMTALRAASRKLASPNLAGCAVYASGHPCPMCMAAMRLSGVTRVAYAYSNDDGAPFGLSSAAIYEDLAKPFADQSMAISYVPVRPEGRADLYEQWAKGRSGRQ